ncbi:MAG: tripartite tricarboxylate transporter substrate binding protein [Burkholderiales bacterium]|jgi:tripartite-type tricarboxylate transporter receptor subunit TctC|nr:tripartite tricarboxylate transporter substrate binding protein [Burkholderiales bacterium]
MNTRKIINGALLLAATAAVPSGALAAAPGREWKPNKPLRFIVGFPPGGATDLVARIMQPKLSELLGNQVVVDNRPGANGQISLQIISGAEPDGHTIGMGHIGGLVISPAIQKVAYDPVKDFSYIGMLVTLQNILIVHPSVPAKNLNEFLAHAKSQQGRLNYASSGIGSPGHLSGVLFEALTKTPMTHIPYKGGGPAITDLIAGHVPSFFAVISTSIPHVKSGKVRAIAVTGNKRASAIPEVPTMAEAGVKGYLSLNWYGSVAPAGTPSAIITRLNRDISTTLKSPDVVKQLDARGIDAAPSTPAEYRAFADSERKRWLPVIKAAGISAQ